MAFISVWVSVQKLALEGFSFCFCKYSEGQFWEEAVQFSSITFHMSYLATVIYLVLLMLSSIWQNFAIKSRMIKSVSFHQCTEFMWPFLLHQRNHSLFHMQLFSTYLICLPMQCDSLGSALLLHKCFFVCFATAACSSLGWDAQLLLCILHFEM